MDRQQANAIQIADFLQSHKFKVHYPGLKTHPQYELHAKMSRGPGAVLSFETGNVELSEKLVELTRLWGISVSFGCVNSLIRYVCQKQKKMFVEKKKKKDCRVTEADPIVDLLTH
jgi:cystathionine beta-lyase